MSKKVNYTEKDALIVQGFIKDTYAKVKQHQFFEGCGEAYCTWCNFVRHNILADSFSGADIEALDG